MTTRPEITSQLNLLPETTTGHSFAPRMRITDVTLREAEQSGLGIWFDAGQKLELGRALERIGVGTIQVGYPGSSERDAEMTKMLADDLKVAKVEGVALVFVDDWQGQVDACIATGASVLLISCRGSKRHRDLLGMNEDDVVERVAQATARATAHDLVVGCAVSDTTRTELEVLRRMWTAAAEAGAARITIADSVGAASPELIEFLVHEAKRITGLVTGVHCHNDFGLAVANTLAGARAGAEVLDVAVNGLGDRAGNSSLEEVVAALEFVYGIDSGIRSEDLTLLSTQFSEAAGVPVPPWKAITGSAVFTHTLPTHVAAMERDTRALQPIEPEAVGNVQTLGNRPASQAWTNA